MCSKGFLKVQLFHRNIPERLLREAEIHQRISFLMLQTSKLKRSRGTVVEVYLL